MTLPSARLKMRPWFTWMLALLIWVHCNAGGAADAGGRSIEWRLPVATRASQSQQVRQHVQRLGEALGQKAVLLLETNPICCFWVEIWSPSPGKDGYVIEIQQGGAILRASNLDQLGKAVDALIHRIEINNGKHFIPGNVLITNIPVVVP